MITLNNNIHTAIHLENIYMILMQWHGPTGVEQMVAESTQNMQATQNDPLTI